MAPVKKFAITITSLTALALVMSACAGNLEAKKFGVGNTGMLKNDPTAAQKLSVTDDGTSTFDENCAPSEELKAKSETESEISVAELIDGKSNKYVLERNEFIKATLDKTVSPSTSKVIAAKGQGNNVAIVCHNSKIGSSADIISFANPVEFDSNDGSSVQSREIELITEDGKIGAQTSIIERPNNLAKLEEIKKQGGELSVTKDASGTIRIRYSVSEEQTKTFFHASQLLVYKVMTAEQAEAAKTEEQKQDDNAAQAAADAVANEAGIPTESEAQASPDMAEAQRKLNERLRQQSEELVRKQQAEIQADMDRRADQALAKAEERLRPKLPPCVVSSADAPCPNESRQAQMALAAAQYRAQQEFAAKMAGASTTTTTTQPKRTSRPADAIDYTSPGSYPR